MKRSAYSTLMAILFALMTSSYSSAQEEYPEAFEIISTVARNDKPFASQLKSLDSLYKLFRAENNTLGKQLVLIAKGDRYIRIGAYTASLESLHEAYEMGGKDMQSWANYLTGVVFIELENYDKALSYLEKVKDFNQTTFNREAVEPNLFHLMAVCYIELSKPDQALELYTEAIRKATSKDMERILAIMLIRKGMLLAEEFGQFESAMADLMRAEELLDEPDEQFLLASCYHSLGKLHLLMNNTAKVPQYITASDSLSRKFNRADLILDNLQLRADYYYKIGQLNKAFDYLEQYGTMKDSINGASTKRQISDLQEVFDKEQQQKRLIKKQKELELSEAREKLAEQRTNSIYIILVLSLLLFGVIIYKVMNDFRKKKAVYAMQKRLKEAEIANKEMEKQSLEKELTSKNRSLTDMAIDISRKKEFIEELHDRLKKISRSVEKDTLIRDTIHFLSQQSRIDENLSLLWNNVDTINHEFYGKLMQMHPDLTEGERQFCSLIRLKLTNKEIATIRGITPDSTKNMRSKLKKKLNLEKGVSLQEYLVKF